MDIKALFTVLIYLFDIKKVENVACNVEINFDSIIVNFLILVS